MRRSLLVLAVAALGACDGADTPLAPDLQPSSLLAAATDGSIPGHYVVQLSWGANASALAAEYGLKPRYVYEHLLNGFAGSIPDAKAKALSLDPRVLKISVQRQYRVVSTTQSGATWGLDRIDQRARPVDGNYTYDFDGAGVTAYIIDTGIRFDHVEFEGRAVPGFDAYAADPTDPLLIGDMNNDCQGHGTHVAGTVGGKTYGVAKQAKLVAVRVLNCAGYGSDADVIAGMDWVAANATLPAVVNMSLGDVIPTKTLGTSAPIDDAVRGMISSGITVVVAAGNGWGNGTIGADACMFPIANVAEAITVAASNAADTRTSWTNYGACVDIFAPGDGITSAYNTSSTATDVLGGTSMASPHVAGAAALVLQQAPGATPQQVRDLLVASATQNIVVPVTLNSGHTMNSHLLYSRVTVPVTTTTEPVKTKPCTPRRQRQGECVSA
ncbi:S8 family peptidase [Longimicrobium sp.]|jgi:subtilisin family serine protease|uniref:S8 family peptidase n=1 Tax=Longimicrobium sp. TaxID=2029185 RepID=UPI002ED9E5E8